MNMLVTAVIPTYNYAHFLPRAIESVLSQTYPHLECVVVDDGSTDHTPQVLAHYADRIRPITQVNQGLSAARNAGIRAARGSAIALLDADDQWLPEKIAAQVGAWKTHPDAGAIGCGAEVVGSSGERVSFLEFAAQYPPRGAARALVAQLRAVAARRFWVSGSGSGALIPKAVLDDVGGFDQTLRAAEDWDMWLRIAAKYPIYNVPAPLARIFQHGSGGFRNADKMERNQWEVYERALSRWPDRLDPFTKRRMRALILADAGGELIFAKEFALAMRRYGASLREWPFNSKRWKLFSRALLKSLKR